MADDPTYEQIRHALSRPDGLTPTGLSRRRFLQGVLAAGGLATAGSWVLDAAAAFAAPVGPSDGILVTIQLGGGNDGLNTVVPVGDPAYYANRPYIALPAGSVLPVGPGVGLHPSLTRLHDRFNAGQVAVVRGVGYPNPDLSHFTSMAIWMSAMLSPGTSGWLGRYLDGLGPDLLRAVTIGSSVPLHLVGDTTQATALPESLGDVFGLDRSNPADARMYDAVASFGSTTTGLGPLADEWGSTERGTMGLASQIAAAYAQALPSGDLTTQLALCARLINADLGIRLLDTALGGFDTHADELSTHVARFTEFDNAVQTFYDILDPKWANQVTLMTFSEFGRRVEDNASGGTDHGTASDLFVIGNNVKGGLVGAQPSLTARDPNGNLVMNTDFRSVYGTVLTSWLNGDANAILGGSFPVLPLFAAAPEAVTST